MSRWVGGPWVSPGVVYGWGGMGAWAWAGENVPLGGFGESIEQSHKNTRTSLAKQQTWTFGGEVS